MCECWRVDGWGWLPEEGNRLMTAFPGGSRTGVVTIATTMMPMMMMMMMLMMMLVMQLAGICRGTRPGPSCDRIAHWGGCVCGGCGCCSAAGCVAVAALQSSSDTPWAGVKVRDPPPSQRIGKDTCSHVQDKCKTFCASRGAPHHSEFAGGGGVCVCVGTPSTPVPNACGGLSSQRSTFDHRRHDGRGVPGGFEAQGAAARFFVRAPRLPQPLRSREAAREGSLPCSEAAFVMTRTDDEMIMMP
jgi:hypothetical protein